jgi:predicted nucleotide-binding protein
MAQQDVAGALLSRARIANRAAMESTLTTFRDALSNLREQAVSILSIAIARHPDDFLARQLKCIEEIKIAAPGRIANAMLPQGQLLSRDTRAVAEGLALAPHQILKAITISARLVTDGSPTLERAVRLSANHVQRVERLGATRGNAGRNVVIGHGHSSQWRDLKDFIKDRLGLPHDEFNRLSVAGVANTDRLTEMLDAAAIAFIVLTGEDELKDNELRARQNVVHEVGLFQGRLGFKKAIVMLEEGCEEFSNIAGLGQLRFPKGNIRAVFEDVRKVLEREGIIAA